MCGKCVPANKRWNAKRDHSEPDIVKDLRAAGYKVYRDLPVDMLVRRPYWEPGTFLAMEAKTPQKKGGVRKRKDQPKQQATLRECGIPLVTNSATALEAVRAVHHDKDMS